MKLKRQFYIGLDLGKKRDYSAIAVVEQCVWTAGDINPVSFAPKLERHTVLRHISRVKKETKYLQIVERVREMLVSDALRNEDVVFAMDATGVGDAVMELVEGMIRSVNAQRQGWLNWAGVVFTSGTKTTWRQYEANVPKNSMMDELVLLVEKQELVLDSSMRGVKELMVELQHMQQVRNENGTRWVSVGEHDDLVMALALAVWGTSYREVPKTHAGLRRGRRSW